ncbi:hypothetical protein M707_02595 [Arthrobacter sp. AK-YN10]|nr:hypothetical protein M707_02595 [Arthrobacter sp. AK-YN10]
MTAAGIPALLEPIQERLNAATPGPWKTVRHDLSLYVVAESGELNPINLGYVGNRPERDAVFIAASPTDTARLLAAVKAVDSILSQALTMISADPDVSEYERGFDDSTCGLSAKLRAAVEAALRSEA